LQNPSVTYNTPGTYNVKLKVTNTAGSDSIEKQNIIIVSDPLAAQPAPFIEGFETNINNYLLTNQNGNAWSITDSAKYSGNNSLWISNFSNNYPNSIDEIITPSIDLTAFSPAPTTLFMKFKLAYTGRTSTNILTQVTDTIWDFLKVYVSLDCGKSWTQRYSKSGTQLATAPLTTARFFPASTSQWRQESISLNPYIPENNVRFKFLLKSGGGNNIFIDDINIDVANGIEELAESALNLSIHPNPMNETSEIDFDLSRAGNVKIEVLDLVGKQVELITNNKFETGHHSINISKEELGAAGFYFLKLTNDGKSCIQKIVVN
jgi:hypothetical protein